MTNRFWEIDAWDDVAGRTLALDARKLDNLEK